MSKQSEKQTKQKKEREREEDKGNEGKRDSFFTSQYFIWNLIQFQGLGTQRIKGEREQKEREKGESERREREKGERETGPVVDN